MPRLSLRWGGLRAAGRSGSGAGALLGWLWEAEQRGAALGQFRGCSLRAAGRLGCDGMHWIRRAVVTGSGGAGGVVIVMFNCAVVWNYGTQMYEMDANRRSVSGWAIVDSGLLEEHQHTCWLRCASSWRRCTVEVRLLTGVNGRIVCSIGGGVVVRGRTSEGGLVWVLQLCLPLMIVVEVSVARLWLEAAAVLTAALHAVVIVWHVVSVHAENGTQMRHGKEGIRMRLRDEQKASTEGVKKSGCRERLMGDADVAVHPAPSPYRRQRLFASVSIDNITSPSRFPPCRAVPSRPWLSIAAAPETTSPSAFGRFLPRPRPISPDISDESSLTLSSIFSSEGALSPATLATSPAPAPGPALLRAALSAIATTPPTPLDDMSEIHPTLFKGDGAGENTTDFLNAICRRNLVSPTWKDPEKVEFFKLSLKSGSYAKHVPAPRSGIPEAEKEMAIQEKGELQEELLSLKLRPEEVGVRVEEDGIEEWGQVRWAIKVTEIATRIEDDGGLIPQALKNIPDLLLLRLGPKRKTWVELVQTMKDIPSSDVAGPQTPSRGLSTAFAGMAASSPTRCVLFPQTPTTTTPMGRVYRTDSERLRMIQKTAVTIHPHNQAGLAAYTQQIAAYAQKHRTLKPSEERPYPLTPGTIGVGSGECHKCGTMGHFSTERSATGNLLIPEIEVRWRQIVQSIRTRAACNANTVAVNIVVDASEDVFGTAEYDHAVIQEYLRTQEKAEGDWWRASSTKSADIAAMHETTMGGDSVPPTRQVPDPAPPVPENPDEHPVTGRKAAAADDLPELQKPAGKRAKRKRGGRRKQERKKVNARDLPAPKQEVAAGPGLSEAADVGGEKKEEGDVQSGGARVGLSAQRRRVIAAWREERQQNGEELERVEAVTQRGVAAEAKAQLVALVGKNGTERKWTKQERMAWRRMKALGSGGHMEAGNHDAHTSQRAPAGNGRDNLGPRRPRRIYRSLQLHVRNTLEGIRKPLSGE
ncbi:hypothetical protein B0H17DRAFT_1145919 [Mycena rosella]|uniref:Uncharacterized protein n=1 Tax=Mycena rosella TaxID=1033263 RepID=A0AAD7CPZ5_MYCRO|nr:hypothetical protein B0H17DRAFT_1145919 [Mycena rosella]